MFCEDAARWVACTWARSVGYSRSCWLQGDLTISRRPCREPTGGLPNCRIFQSCQNFRCSGRSAATRAPRAVVLDSSDSSARLGQGLDDQFCIHICVLPSEGCLTLLLPFVKTDLFCPGPGRLGSVPDFACQECAGPQGNKPGACRRRWTQGLAAQLKRRR